MLLARVTDHGFELSITVAIGTGDAPYGFKPQAFLVRTPDGFNWEQATDSVTTTSDATFTVSDEIAHAIYEGLHRHFSGTDSQASLRRDFDHSEKQRDYLESVICMLADKLATAPPSTALAEIREFPPR